MISVTDFPYICRCCGERVTYQTVEQAEAELYGHRRCEKHMDRDPCAIEGCTKTTARPKLCGPDDGKSWLCGVHWRIGVLPRSKLRRHYHRYFAIAKRHGWQARIGKRCHPHRVYFWRFWLRIVLPAARARCEEGRIDVEEIHKMFGWDQ